MPTNPEHEWRWDDDCYGHYRRYRKGDVRRLLADCGFEMLEFWDYTFPVFWAMRRAYTNILPARQPEHAVPELNTMSSGLREAANVGALSRFAAALPVWPAIYALQRLFRTGPHGFEAMLLARSLS
jgi:hypothetical protein